MSDQDLQNVFKEYMEQDSFFQNKDILSFSYNPDEILHREEQINELASILAPALKGEEPSNVFVYGTVGTGKTLVMNHISEHLKTVSKDSDVSLETVYINCKLKKVADTEYRLLAQLARELGKDVPSTGLPTSEVHNYFVEALKEKEGVVIIIMDEIDTLVKKIGDDFLYGLTRLNEDLGDSRVSIVGISNDLNFTDYMDARVKSTLSEEEVIFPPYNALELKEILRHRGEQALLDSALQEGVISKCAALAAQEQGDARRALDLLRVAGELAERDNKTKITTGYVDKAQSKIERDRVVEAVKNQPKQSKIVLASIVELNKQKGGNIDTGELYNYYKDKTNNMGVNTLTQRRVSDLISELNILGVINAKVVSKGKYGRTRKININLAPDVVKKLKDSVDYL